MTMVSNTSCGLSPARPGPACSMPKSISSSSNRSRSRIRSRIHTHSRESPPPRPIPRAIPPTAPTGRGKTNQTTTTFLATTATTHNQQLPPPPPPCPSRILVCKSLQGRRAPLSFHPLSPSIAATCFSDGLPWPCLACLACLRLAPPPLPRAGFVPRRATSAFQATPGTSCNATPVWRSTAL